jgi:hypothetical protein
LSASKANNGLKEDILPLVFSLMTNKTLKELDISGNQIGNQLALSLNKVLQTNRTLESLIWDGNDITGPGFHMFLAGLRRNNVLKNMPLPLNDINAASKDKVNTHFVDILKQIQEVSL